METQQPQKKISYRILFITHFSCLFIGAVIMYLSLKYISY